jgi:hypothetical protein
LTAANELARTINGPFDVAMDDRTSNAPSSEATRAGLRGIRPRRFRRSVTYSVNTMGGRLANRGATL